MKFGIIGCGSIGRRHIRTLLELGHEVLAYNRGDARRAAVESDFGIRVFERTEAVFAERIDAAVICSPNNLHVNHALQAARKGAHLFIEKPLSYSLEDVETLREEVSKSRLISHVGSNMRFHFGPEFIKAELARKTLGKILWASVWAGMYLPDWHPDENYRQMYSAKKNLGGGAVLDFIHELDLVLWFFGRPEFLAAMTGRSGWLEIETEDMADALLRYSGDFQINLHIDYLQRPAQRGIRVVGTRGWVVWDLAREIVEVYQHETGQKAVFPYPEGYDNQSMYTNQMKYFINCIKSGKNSASDLDAGKQALIMALKIKESSVTGRFVNWQAQVKAPPMIKQANMTIF